MPRKKVKPISINLVPKDPFFETPVGKILRWALSVGRYIVIFTELIVIMSFVTRFNLDRQVTDLNDSINQKAVRLESLQDLEMQIRQVQAKIDQYQQIRQSEDLTQAFPELSTITPQDVRLDELLVRPDQVTMTGTALSQASLNLLITNIQLSEYFRNVSVDQISSGDAQDPGFKFQISAVIGQEVRAVSTSGGGARTDVLDHTQGL